MGWEVQSIEDVEGVEGVTDDDVAAAVEAAAEAEAAIKALEERVIEGDEDVSFEQIEEQRGRSRFAKLRAAAVERKAARAKQAARLRACDELRREIEENADGLGEAMAKAIRSAEDALVKVYTLSQKRTDTIGAWRRRARKLDLPRHVSPFAPDKSTAHLAWNEHELIAGSRRIIAYPYDLDNLVSITTKRAKSRAEGKPWTGADPAADLAKVDKHEREEPPADAQFWRDNESGTIFRHDNPNDAIVERSTRLSSKEARRLWGAQKRGQGNPKP